MENTFVDKDVSELLRHVYNGSNKDTLKQIREEAVKIGHAGLLLSEAEVSKEPLTRDTVVQALKNAVPLRGFSIDDPRTSVGLLFHLLHKPDFDDMMIRVSEGKEERYRSLTEDLKTKVNKYILFQEGYLPKEYLS